jgi:hypothetical protein
MSRSRLIIGALFVTASLAVYGLWWMSSAQAIRFTGTGGGGPVGMPPLKNPEANLYDRPSDAPPNFGWHRGGYVLLGYLFHNSLSVPITITGAKRDGLNGSALSDPALYVPSGNRHEAYDLGHIKPLRDLHIAAGGDAEIVLVWRSQGRCADVATSTADGATSSLVERVHLEYTVLGIFHESEWVPMSEAQAPAASGAYLFAVTAPRADQCPDGYPLRDWQN